MDILEIMEKRHSVRQYKDIKIDDDIKNDLTIFINKINDENNLHLQLFFNEPTAFNTMMAHYGKFEGVSNYLALIGKDEERLGYFGELFSLHLTSLGLHSCFVALTYGKRKVKWIKEKGEKLYCVISFGHGKNKGFAHKNKPLEKLVKIIGDKPDFLDRGIKACMLAPTAINQQKFLIISDNGKISIKINGKGFYTKMDLGIIKCHFELATNIKVN